MRRLFALLTLCVLLVGCKDDTETGGLSIDDSQLNITLDNGASSKKVRFTANQSWTMTITANTSSDDWCIVSPTNGEAGEMAVNVNAEANTSGDDRTLTLLLKSGPTEKTITVFQPSQEVFEIAETTFRAGPEGKDIEIPVKSNVEFTCEIPQNDQVWIQQLSAAAAPDARASMQTTVLKLRILPGDKDRTSTITLVSAKAKKEIQIIQAYESTDYSADGTVVTLQTAQEGNGIDIIFMGDAFDDRDIADGAYLTTTKKAMEAFFGEEPYTTYRNLFNVYVVNVVSKNGSYFDGADTALKGKFSASAATSNIVSGDDKKCKDYYAYKIPNMSAARLNETLIIVMMNRAFYAGTCYMYASMSSDDNDYGSGTSVAYFPLGTDDTMFNQIVHHEAGGHGFPKLGDEYFYGKTDQIPQKDIDDINARARANGWYKNNDFTNDPARIKWHTFISDERYANEHVGVYEGAALYPIGAYRPTYNSIMRINTGGFNAPSREAIYNRIHKLAYGSSWTFDYEKFVEYDAINRNKPAQAQRTFVPQNFVPLAPPVVVGKPL